MIRRCAVPALTVALACTLAACSSSGSGDKTAPGPTTTPTASKSPARTVLPTQPKSVPTAVPNAAALRKMVTQGPCQAVAGGWENSGTVKNTTGKAHTFTITVFFTTQPGGTVLGYGDVKVPVAAGATRTWRVAKKFPATKTMNCVLRGVA